MSKAGGCAQGLGYIPHLPSDERGRQKPEFRRQFNSCAEKEGYRRSGGLSDAAHRKGVKGETAQRLPPPSSGEAKESPGLCQRRAVAHKGWYIPHLPSGERGKLCTKAWSTTLGGSGGGGGGAKPPPATKWPVGRGPQVRGRTERSSAQGLRRAGSALCLRQRRKVRCAPSPPGRGRGGGLKQHERACERIPFGNSGRITAKAGNTQKARGGEALSTLPRASRRCAVFSPLHNIVHSAFVKVCAKLFHGGKRPLRGRWVFAPAPCPLSPPSSAPSP